MKLFTIFFRKLEAHCSNLINSAIAQAENPPLMAQAINYGVKAGRQAFLAGRIKKQDIAVASSPEKNISI